MTSTVNKFLTAAIIYFFLALVYRHWMPRPRYGQWVFILFNLGLPLAIIGQPGPGPVGVQLAGWAGIAGLRRLLQLVAGSFFAWEVAGLLRRGGDD
jgi:hypothetical protein